MEIKNNKIFDEKLTKNPGKSDRYRVRRSDRPTSKNPQKPESLSFVIDETYRKRRCRVAALSKETIIASFRGTHYPLEQRSLGESAHRWNKNARWIEERWRHGWLALRKGGGSCGHRAGVGHCDVESMTSDAGRNVTNLAGFTAKALSELEFVPTRLWLYLVGMTGN